MKVLALVAHDNMKRDLAEWVDWNCAKLSAHHLVCTGTTGKMVERTLRDHHRDEEPNALPHPSFGSRCSSRARWAATSSWVRSLPTDASTR